MDNFSKQMRHIRDNFAATQEQLSEILGMSVKRLRYLEQGRAKSWKLKELETLERLGYRREWLLTGEGEPKAEEVSAVPNGELVLLITEAVDEWLYSQQRTLRPEIKAKIVRTILTFYSGREEKASRQDIRDLAIPFALKIVV